MTHNMSSLGCYTGVRKEMTLYVFIKMRYSV